MKRVLFAIMACIIAGMPLRAARPTAPEWMHALVSAPLPAHDEKDNAVLLYYEKNLTVISADKFRTTIRKAYKILRPEGREYGLVSIPFDSFTKKISNMHGWCIPAEGKDYEVNDKDAAEVSPLKEDDGSLITDERIKVSKSLRPIPEISSATNTTWIGIRWFCRTPGISNDPSPCGKVTIPSRFPPDGSLKMLGSTTHK